MKLDAHYTDARLVALYDAANQPGADAAFYRRLAADLGATTLIDLGCGTDLMTRELVADNRRIIGVDPAPAMLEVARHNDVGNLVEWIEGDSQALGTPDADLVLMTGNVPQVFLEDEAWDQTLADIHRALRPGGQVAFESPNPAARAWESWTPEATRTVSQTPFGPVKEWLEVLEVREGVVRCRGHTVFRDRGEVLIADSSLRFRELDEMHASLERAGFSVNHVFGDWQRGPFLPESPLMIIVAQRSGQP